MKTTKKNTGKTATGILSEKFIKEEIGGISGIIDAILQNKGNTNAVCPECGEGKLKLETTKEDKYTIICTECRKFFTGIGEFIRNRE